MKSKSKWIKITRKIFNFKIKIKAAIFFVKIKKIRPVEATTHRHITYIITHTQIKKKNTKNNFNKRKERKSILSEQLKIAWQESNNF